MPSRAWRMRSPTSRRGSEVDHIPLVTLDGEVLASLLPQQVSAEGTDPGTLLVQYNQLAQLALKLETLMQSYTPDPKDYDGQAEIVKIKAAHAWIQRRVLVSLLASEFATCGQVVALQESDYAQQQQKMPVQRGKTT